MIINNIKYNFHLKWIINYLSIILMTSCYATELALVAEIRPTDDVDIVIELASYGGCSQLDEKLRELPMGSL